DHVAGEGVANEAAFTVTPRRLRIVYRKQGAAAVHPVGEIAVHHFLGRQGQLAYASGGGEAVAFVREEEPRLIPAVINFRYIHGSARVRAEVVTMEDRFGAAELVIEPAIGV